MDPYRLIDRLSCMDLPDEGDAIVDGPESLLTAFSAGCDTAGRYYARGWLMRRLFWWQEPMPTGETVEVWRDELVSSGNLRIRPLGRSSFTDRPVDIALLQHRSRFPRFKNRTAIPLRVRVAVYDRDGWTCLHCGAIDDLSLDHIYPYSLGGTDDVTNLQTLCRPCNSRKGARL